MASLARITMAALITAIVFVTSCGGGGDGEGSWNLPAPERTFVTPRIGVYRFDAGTIGGDFAVVRNEETGGLQVSFRKCNGCVRPEFDVVDGGFYYEWGEIDGTHCPTDGWGISGSFTSETEAYGIIKYAYDCTIFAEESFRARLIQ